MFRTIVVRTIRTHLPSIGKVRIPRHHHLTRIGTAIQIASPIINVTTIVIRGGDDHKTVQLGSLEPVEPRYTHPHIMHNVHFLLGGAGRHDDTYTSDAAK